MEPDVQNLNETQKLTVLEGSLPQLPDHHEKVNGPSTSPHPQPTATRVAPADKDRLLGWAKYYRDSAQLGFVPIILDPMSKGVTRKGWQHEKGTDGELEGNYSPGSNLGILIGNASNRLVDIDLDDPAAVRLAPRFLPPTHWKSGHAVSRDSHWYYKLKLGSAEPGTHRFKYKAAHEKVCVLEYRWDGVQTVVFPSVHPDHGARYMWSTTDGTPPTTPAPEEDGALLYKRCQYLFMACMLDEIWLPGQRHEVQVAASAALLKAGVAKEEIVEFFTLLGGLQEKREYTVQRTLERIENGEPVKSAGSLVTEYSLPQPKLDAFLKTLGRGQSPLAIGMSQAAAAVLLKQVQGEITANAMAALAKWAPRATEVSEAAATDEGNWLALMLTLNEHATNKQREPFVGLINKKLKEVQKARASEKARLAEQAELASTMAKSLEAAERGQSEVQRLNEGYAFIVVGGNSAVLDERPKREGDGLGMMELMSTQAFREYYANRTVPDERSSGKECQLGHYWLTHKNRRQYDGLMFKTNPTPEEDAGYYNLFRGYKRKPSRTGTCRLWLRHVREVVCQKDKQLYLWVLAWMAHLVQKPDGMPGVALVLQGVQGCGKGIVIRALMEMFNGNTLHVSDPRHLVGNFNKHLLGCCLLYADESYWAGDVKHEGALKRLITEPTLAIEVKGRDVFPAQNRISLAISSNNEWVVPATWDGRRFTVIQVADKYAPAVAGAADSDQYFGRISDELKHGGYERLFQLLRDLNLEKLPSPRQHMSTRALKEQVLEGLDAVSRWWLNCLQRGYVVDVDSRQQSGPATWETTLSKSDVVKQYGVDDSKAYRSAASTLGKKLRKLCPSMRPGQTRTGREQWIFPSLADARGAFEQYIGSQLDWDFGGIAQVGNQASPETQSGAGRANLLSSGNPLRSAAQSDASCDSPNLPGEVGSAVLAPFALEPDQISAETKSVQAVQAVTLLTHHEELISSFRPPLPPPAHTAGVEA